MYGSHLKLDPYYSNSPIFFRLFLQPFHDLLPQKRTQPQTKSAVRQSECHLQQQQSEGNGDIPLPPFPSNNPIRPRILIAPITINKPPLGINLQTPKDILRVRNPSVVRRIAVVVDMNIPTTTTTSCSTLNIRCPTCIRFYPSASFPPMIALVREKCGARSEAGASG